VTASEKLRIGQLSAQVGCNIETIRYYERIGILPPPPRTANGYRLYDGSQRTRLVFIRRARELGFTLDEVRGLLTLVDGGRYTCGEVQALALAHVAEIRRKIADLERLERALSEMAEQCSGGDVPACPIIEILSTACRRPAP
jgi:MerR family mercuric resistance operon transcriptional regulator